MKMSLCLIELYDLYVAYYWYKASKDNSDTSCNLSQVFIEKYNSILDKGKYKDNNNMCFELLMVIKIFEQE
ncbi:PIR Superfamily Protein [Plasmodium ovale wallikeri]|uniref:PIR Superfamily Protein n=1 Tax=Plasmodium ovale wallikeri TaxID=864142 RepID=A0A1A9AKW3_PLAOA|nr:PIR Superfamily Protein [Plasmodium ovale wallikeri]SBT56828.1 PIR Superfamily Protein [Plasmodium ovale wallikeri]